MQHLRRHISLCVVTIAVAVATAFAQAEKVYVTKTGAKYHRASCSSLRYSKIEMPLVEAATRYGPCKNCRPPVPSAPPTVSSSTLTEPVEKVAPKSAPVTSGRCQAITKKGTQCSRNAQAGRKYCWQH